MLEVSIHHRFGGFTLDAAFDAPAGVTVLFGRSGSGKTTIVNAVAGLLKPDAGVIRSGGERFWTREGSSACRPTVGGLATSSRRGGCSRT